jgi:hypothetical protein
VDTPQLPATLDAGNLRVAVEASVLPTGAATEATLATRASEATLATRASEATLATRASEATLLTRATEATVATLATAANQTNGLQRSQVRGGSKGATTPADVTSSSIDADHQGIDIADGGGSITIDGSVTAVMDGDKADLDTGGPVDNHAVVAIGLPGAGGHVVGGTATNPLRTDPTGTTTQPVSDAGGSITVDAPVGTPVATRLSDGAAFLSTPASRLAVDGSGVTQPVSDAGGSLTIDTPQLPAALVGGRLDTNIGAWLSSTAPTVGQKTMASSVPVVIASDQTFIPPATVGTHANAWSAAAVLANGVSASIDTQNCPFISVFGNTDGATTITVQMSQDNTNFYDAESTVANGDFSISNTYGARYIRLKSSQARTITATIAGKD